MSRGPGRQGHAAGKTRFLVGRASAAVPVAKGLSRDHFPAVQTSRCSRGTSPDSAQPAVCTPTPPRHTPFRQRRRILAHRHVEFAAPGQLGNHVGVEEAVGGEVGPSHAPATCLMWGVCKSSSLIHTGQAAAAAIPHPGPGVGRLQHPDHHARPLHETLSPRVSNPAGPLGARQPDSASPAIHAPDCLGPQHGSAIFIRGIPMQLQVELGRRVLPNKSRHCRARGEEGEALGPRGV